MNWRKIIGFVFAGIAAGTVNGLFGGGGGMILVPILTHYTRIEETKVFPCSVSIILPICIISLCAQLLDGKLPFREAWPYLVGGAIGGFLSGYAGNKIPTKYLHRILGILILWGGVRYLC